MSLVPGDYRTEPTEFRGDPFQPGPGRCAAESFPSFSSFISLTSPLLPDTTSYSALCFLLLFTAHAHCTQPIPFITLLLPVLSHRNLSSADAGRQTMRNYSGLIDSLMAYVQNCVAASRCDDKVRLQAPGDTSILDPVVCAHSCKSQGHTLKSVTLLVLTFLSQNP